MDNTLTLRARDFWSALALIAISLFFLWRSFNIAPDAAGPDAAWFTSAALMPVAIFAGLLILSLVLLAISIRSGGAAQALSAAGIGWSGIDAWRFLAIALFLCFYIIALVPRVDFIIASALLITALICSFHGSERPRAGVPLILVGLAALYAFVRHLPEAEWNALDDDIVALAAFAALTLWHQLRGLGGRAVRITPLLAIGLPLVLICAMAFGFRQNVPSRGGLIFKQIEFTYYVHLRPLWRS